MVIFVCKREKESYKKAMSMCSFQFNLSIYFCDSNNEYV